MRDVGDMWTNSNKWMIESTRYSLVNADLEQLALSMLDDMIKLVKEKMSPMMDDDEDEDMKHCLTLRIWSLNTAMRVTLNDEHFRKGQQVDEWLRQESKCRNA
ncbi:hypothetical protein POM88_028946 [Heracleum sosnowskyi]|uniref:Uncharacterized protein n=1 Tax=Heracleum sosnowskyi TaxID=360622 RepID=A0AAD8MI20_9APIA|nr:hypothetical protein POM88_028946 [Heracleum sosnowskyi]